MRLKVVFAICVCFAIANFAFAAAPKAAGSKAHAKAASVAAATRAPQNTSPAVSAAPTPLSTPVAAAPPPTTQNFVAKFADSTGTVTNSSILDNGNVGIGTLNPIAKLQVDGVVGEAFRMTATGSNASAIRLLNSTFSGDAYFGVESSTAGGYFTDALANSTVFYSPGNPIQYIIGGQTRLMIQPNGNVGVGTKTPTSLLSAAGVIESLAGGFKFPDATVQTTALPSGCTANQIPKWSGTAWACQADLTAVGSGGGTVTGVTAGTGLTGGTITLTGTLSVDSTVVPLLSTPNVFTGNQSIGGNVNVTGDVNANNVGAAVAYNLAGFQVLSTNISNQNIFLGSEAGVANIIGGYGDPTSTGSSNTFLGVLAGKFNTSGSYNTLIGANTGTNFSVGKQNTLVGADAGVSAAGDDNTAVGFNSFLNNTATQNTALGSQSGYSTTSGNGNVFLGYKAGFGNTTGSNNTFIGTVAGQTASGSNNIYIGANILGMTESNTMRLGDPAGISSTYIAGVYNVAVSNGVPVVIDATGHIGASAPSSRRFKEAIQPMGDLTEGLMKLHPVTFYYKRSFDPSTQRILQYGLVAEEVAQVYPDLVTYDEEGRPNAIKYQYFTPMLLNELQKQHTVVKQQQAVIESQEERLAHQNNEIRDLQRRLERIENLVTSQKQ